MKFGEKPQTESNPSCVLIFYQQVDQPSQEDVDKVNCFRKASTENILIHLRKTISIEKLFKYLGWENSTFCCQAHQQYIDALCGLYKEHVHKYGNPEVKLVIT